MPSRVRIIWRQSSGQTFTGHHALSALRQMVPATYNLLCEDPRFVVLPVWHKFKRLVAATGSSIQGAAIYRERRGVSGTECRSRQALRSLGHPPVQQRVSVPAGRPLTYPAWGVQNRDWRWRAAYSDLSQEERRVLNYTLAAGRDVVVFRSGDSWPVQRFIQATGRQREEQFTVDVPASAPRRPAVGIWRT